MKKLFFVFCLVALFLLSTAFAYDPDDPCDPDNPDFNPKDCASCMDRARPKDDIPSKNTCYTRGYKCCAQTEGRGTHYYSLDETCAGSDECWSSCSRNPSPTCQSLNYNCCSKGNGKDIHYLEYDATCGPGSECWSRCRGGTPSEECLWNTPEIVGDSLYYISLFSTGNSEEIVNFENAGSAELGVEVPKKSTAFVTNANFSSQKEQKVEYNYSNINIVFVVDTSDSMNDEWKTICDNIQKIENDALSAGVNVRSFRYALPLTNVYNRSSGSFDGGVSGQAPPSNCKTGDKGKPTNSARKCLYEWSCIDDYAGLEGFNFNSNVDAAPEAWAAGIHWIVNNYEWQSNARRIIIYIGDNTPTGSGGTWEDDVEPVLTKDAGTLAASKKISVFSLHAKEMEYKGIANYKAGDNSKNDAIEMMDLTASLTNGSVYEYGSSFEIVELIKKIIISQVTNLKLDTAADNYIDWQYPGILNKTIRVDLNKSTINAFAQQCSTNWCSVPLKLSSDSAGKLYADDLCLIMCYGTLMNGTEMLIKEPKRTSGDLACCYDSTACVSENGCFQKEVNSSDYIDSDKVSCDSVGTFQGFCASNGTAGEWQRNADDSKDACCCLSQGFWGLNKDTGKEECCNAQDKWTSADGKWWCSGESALGQYTGTVCSFKQNCTRFADESSCTENKCYWCDYNNDDVKECGNEACGDENKKNETGLNVCDQNEKGEYWDGYAWVYPAPEFCYCETNEDCDSSLGQFCINYICLTPRPARIEFVSKSRNIFLGETGTILLKIKNEMKVNEEMHFEIVSGNELIYWSWFGGLEDKSERTKIDVMVAPESSKTVHVNLFGGKIGSYPLKISGISYVTGMNSNPNIAEMNVRIIPQEEGLFSGAPDLSWVSFFVLITIAAFFIRS